MPASPPEGYHTVTPQSVVPDPGELLDFVEHVFGATVEDRLMVGDVIVHAEFRIGDSMMMTGASSEELPPYRSSTHVYVDDADAVYEKAMRHGATSVQVPTDQFYGDRAAVVEDGQGNRWAIATRIEDLTNEEVHRRFEEMSG